MTVVVKLTVFINCMLYVRCCWALVEWCPSKLLRMMMMVMMMMMMMMIMVMIMILLCYNLVTKC